MRAFTLALCPLLLAAFSGVVSGQGEAVVYDTPEAVTPAEDGDLEKRAPPAGVYICDQTGWQGRCAWIKLKDGQCMDFIWDAGTSFGPPNGWQCKLYYGANCLGKATNGKLTFPGTPNIGATYNNRLKPQAYKCRPCPKGHSCVNGDAPTYWESQEKMGQKGDDGKCKIWESGEVKTRPC